MNIQHSLKLLTFLALFPVSIFASEAKNKIEESRPLSNFYTHDVLRDARIISPIASQLPTNINPWLFRVSGDANTDEGVKFPIEARLYLPWLLTTVYTEPSQDVQDSLANSTKANVTLGNIYRFPGYITVGYDRLPFGRHASAIMSPANMVTRQLSPQKGVIFSTGFDYALSSDQRFSLSLSMPVAKYTSLSRNQHDSLTQQYKDSIGKARAEIDYNVKMPKYMAQYAEHQLDLLTLERAKRNTKEILQTDGDGESTEDINSEQIKTLNDKVSTLAKKQKEVSDELAEITNSIDDLNKKLKSSPNYRELNDNEEIAFNPIINIRYEKQSPTKLTPWVALDSLNIGIGFGTHKHQNKYSTLFNVNSDIDVGDYNAKFEYLYHGALNKVGLGSALHTELSRRFSKLPLINKPYVLVLGYEFGHREAESTMKPVNNVFLAGRLDLWKERITCITGVKTNFKSLPSLLARLTIALPIS